jgi:hypothetical protein
MLKRVSGSSFWVFGFTRLRRLLRSRLAPNLAWNESWVYKRLDGDNW